MTKLQTAQAKEVTALMDSQFRLNSETQGRVMRLNNRLGCYGHRLKSINTLNQRKTLV